MNLRTVSSIATTATLGLALTVLGCGGSSSASAPSSLSNSGAAQVADGAQAGLPIAARSDAFRLLPPEAKLFFGFDFRKFDGAPIFDRYKQLMVEQMPPEIASLKAVCGIDPLKDIDWALGAMDPESNAMVVLVKGNFTRASVESCVEKMGEANGEKITITAEGDSQVYTGRHDSMFVSWPAESVVAISPDNSRALFDALVGRKTSAAPGAQVAAALKAVDTQSGFWLTTEATPQLTGGLPVDGIAAIRMSAEPSSTLDLVAALECVSADKANEAEAKMVAGLAMIKGNPMGAAFTSMLDKVKIATTDTVVSVNLNLNEDDLAQLESTAKMMGGF